MECKAWIEDNHLELGLCNCPRQYYVLWWSDNLHRIRLARAPEGTDIRSPEVYQWEDLDCSSTVSSKVIGKNSLVPLCPYLHFVYPCYAIFTWPKNDLCKNCRYRPLVTNAVDHLSLACFVFEISGGGFPLRYEVGPDPVGLQVNRNVLFTFKWFK